MKTAIKYFSDVRSFKGHCLEITLIVIVKECQCFPTIWKQEQIQSENQFLLIQSLYCFSFQWEYYCTATTGCSLLKGPLVLCLRKYFSDQHANSRLSNTILTVQDETHQGFIGFIENFPQCKGLLRSFWQDAEQHWHSVVRRESLRVQISTTTTQMSIKKRFIWKLNTLCILCWNITSIFHCLCNCTSCDLLPSTH